MERVVLVAATLATLLAAGCFGAEDAAKPADPVEGLEGAQGGTGAQQSGPGGSQGNDPAVARTDTIGPLRLDYALDGNSGQISVTIEANAVRIEWTQWLNTTAPGLQWSGIDPQTKMTSGLHDGNGTARGIATWDHTVGVTSGDATVGDPKRGTIESPEAGQWTFRINGLAHNVHVTLVGVVSYHDG